MPGGHNDTLEATVGLIGSHLVPCERLPLLGASAVSTLALLVF